MADRLQIYNDALGHLGERRLASLTENVPGRHELDAEWARSVAVLLESGFWNFAVRTVQLTADEDVEPLFGYDYAFQKPEDWVNTVQISHLEDFADPLREYEDEAGYWYADTDTLYLRYISNDANYGLNVGAWTQSFADALAAHLAYKIAARINQNKGDRGDLYQLSKKLLKEAKSRDAMNERTRTLPEGSWLRSRFHGVDRERGRF